MMLKASEKPAIAALSASLVLMVALTAAFYADFILPAAKSVFSLLIIFFELMAPVYILERHHINPKSYNIYAHRLELIFDNFFVKRGVKKLWPDWPALAHETLSLLKICGAVLLPYVVLYLAYFIALAHRFSTPFDFNLTFPPNFWLEVLMQIAVVALPEEIFFRGFLQGALLQAWPNRFFIKGFPLGRAIIVTNIIFALSHFVSGFFPVRLLTFFPGLLFSYLVYKNKTIYSAVLFHAICNIIAQILYLSL